MDVLEILNEIMIESIYKSDQISAKNPIAILIPRGDAPYVFKAFREGFWHGLFCEKSPSFSEPGDKIKYNYSGWVVELIVSHQDNLASAVWLEKTKSPVTN